MASPRCGRTNDISPARRLAWAHHEVESARKAAALALRNYAHARRALASLEKAGPASACTGLDDESREAVEEACA